MNVKEHIIHYCQLRVIEKEIIFVSICDKLILIIATVAIIFIIIVTDTINLVATDTIKNILEKILTITMKTTTKTISTISVLFGD